MDREVKLSHVDDVLGEFGYPLSKGEAVDAADGIVLLYADGEERLDAVIGRSNADAFSDVDDLRTELFNNLPTEAVGEPGQSEGEG